MPKFSFESPKIPAKPAEEEEQEQEVPATEETAPPEPIDRRAFLRKIAALGIGALGLATFAEDAEAKRRAQKKPAKAPPKKQLPKKSAQKPRQKPEAWISEPTPEYNAGDLAGRRLNDLYSLYTGVKGRVPEKVRVHFAKQLGLMWQLKGKRVTGSSVAAKVGRELTGNYRSLYKAGRVSRMDLPGYLAFVGKNIRKVKADINWQRIADEKNLSAERLSLLRDITTSISDADLVSYSLTELMPSSDGETNLEVLDFLLRSAGREYLEAIPAVYDAKTSFGPYQFTEYALYDTPREKRGASIINLSLAKEKIPGSVAGLRGEDHYTAALLFIISNLADLIRRLTPKQLAVLKGSWRGKQNEIMTFVATAHHQPYPALDAAERWLDNGARLPYWRSCNPRLTQYSRKTIGNLGALEKRKAAQGTLTKPK